MLSALLENVVNGIVLERKRLLSVLGVKLFEMRNNFMQQFHATQHMEI